MYSIKEEHALASKFSSLQLASQEMELLQSIVTRFVSEFDAKQESAPASYPLLSELGMSELLLPPPEQSQVIDASGISELLSVVNSACETGIETTSGKQLSYMPGCGLQAAALGRYLGAALNRFTGASKTCPGAVALEKSVIDWMLSLFGFDSRAGGVLLSGASLSNFTAVVAARNQLGEDFQKGTVYVSGNTHHSVLKACRLAGIPKCNVRIIGLNGEYSMHMGELEAAIVEDRALGLHPLLVVATAGSTDMGAVDDLGRCAALAKAHGLWMHVDAAYGGFFVLTERGKRRLAGIELADSIAVDAHKSLFMPFGLGALLIADRTRLHENDSEWGGYMHDLAGGEALPDFCLLGPELTRPFRGLEMWLPLHLHGVASFRNVLNTMLDFSDQAGKLLADIPNIEVVANSHLSIVSFRCREGDGATAFLLDTLNSSGHVHVSSCKVQGKLTLRLVFLSPKISMKVVLQVIDVIKEAQCQAA